MHRFTSSPVCRIHASSWQITMGAILIAAVALDAWTRKTG
jgi:hypothetical protein